ncbi:MAG: heme biosynthesis protein HemY [Hyphomicrobium sp.]|nr:heme biosynthesis protein HemY [Hyphomicrobium sp.]
MVRLVIYLLSILLIASGLGWLADRPGTLQIAWQGYDIETSLFRAVVLLAATIATAIFLWSMARAIWNSPAALGNRVIRRRQKRGLEALSSGMIAVGAGDKALASRYAIQARKALPHEPLTHLLRAQAAQLAGDRATTRRIYEAMLASPETEQLGLRGLYLEAEREGETEAAAQFANRALKTNPKLGWSAESLFQMQCKQKDWTAALDTLAVAKRNAVLEKASIDRKRAVLLTAQAQDLEDDDADKALGYALEAHALANDLAPAAAIAGRILASRGNTGKAAKVLQKAWTRSPHPDIATAYAYARIGDSARDRLNRVRQLALLNPQSIEGPIAIATTAIEARLFDEARSALEPLLANRLTQRVATLMARIEAGDSGDKGKVREWLARAANAARDPVWFADGVISNRWEPVSPIDGRLDAFQWRVPAETLDPASADLVASRIEELLALSGPDPEVDASSAVTSSALDDDTEIIDAEAVTVRTTPAPQPVDATPLQPTAQNAAARDVEDDAVQAPVTPAAATIVADAVDAAPLQAKPVAPVAAPAQDKRPEKSQPQPADSRVSNRPDTRIFVTPRAPDDPGLDEPEADNVSPLPRRPFRAVN